MKQYEIREAALGTDSHTVLILGKIAEAGTRHLVNHGDFRLIERPDHAEDRFDLAAEAEAIIVRMTPVDHELLAAAPKLLFVSRHGVGYDTVNLEALNARGIPLAVTGDVNSGAVAEHALALMLAMAKKVTAYDRSIRDGDFKVRDSFSAIELSGRIVFLIGFGRIGRKVANLCTAFGMSVVIFDPYLKASDIEGTGFRLVDDLKAGLPDADFVTVHAPLTPDTRHIIDADAICLMKPGARLINVARGGLVDESAVLEGLESGKLSGAAFDVFEEEPPSDKNPLLADKRTVLSPHCAAFTMECGDRMAVSCAENVIGFFDGTLQQDLVINRQSMARTNA